MHRMRIAPFRRAQGEFENIRSDHLSSAKGMAYSSGVRVGNDSHINLRSFFRLRDHHFALAQIFKASAVARSICASLAAAPCRAADGRRVLLNTKSRWCLEAPPAFLLLCQPDDCGVLNRHSADWTFSIPRESLDRESGVRSR